MQLLTIVIICVVLYVVYSFVTKGHLTIHMGHMNWVGIVVHSIFVGALLYLVISFFSRNTQLASEWGLIGMGCIIGWNLLIASDII